MINGKLPTILHDLEQSTQGLRSMLGKSPIQQPMNIFSMTEYKTFMESRMGLVDPRDLEWQQKLKEANEIYRSRLPRYLLAVCPICGGRIWEAIDTFSLNGKGWRGGRYRGKGWYGPIDLTPYAWGEKGPSYEAECNHIQVMDWCINLNRINPDDVTFQVVETLSEVPHLLGYMTIPDTYCVLHALPIGRFDDIVPTSHYTAYFMTYFSTHSDVFEERHNRLLKAAGEADPYLEIIPPFDFDLLKWVNAKRLYWLNEDNWALENDPPEKFPYAHIRGYKGRVQIVEGRVNIF